MHVQELRGNKEGNVWSSLSGTPEIIRLIAARLPRNEAARCFRLLSRDVAESLKGSHDVIYVPKERASLGYFSDDVYIATQPWFGVDFVARFARPEPWRSLSYAVRLRLLCLAASSHHAPSLDAALAFSGVGLTSTAIVEAAAASGDLDACRRLVAAGCECSFRAVELAAFRGRLPVLQWIWWEPNPAFSEEKRQRLEQEQRDWDRMDRQARAMEARTPPPPPPPATLRRAFGWADTAYVAFAACAGGQGEVLTWLERGMWRRAGEAPNEQEEAEQPQAQQQPQPAGEVAAGAAAGGLELQEADKEAAAEEQDGDEEVEEDSDGSEDPDPDPDQATEKPLPTQQEVAAARAGRFAPPTGFKRSWLERQAMAREAASRGHTALLRRLLLPPGVVEYGRLPRDRHFSEIDFAVVTHATYGCPLEELQALFGAWEPGQRGVPGGRDGAVWLLRAATSPTPDWRAKADYVCEKLRLRVEGRAGTKPSSEEDVEEGDNGDDGGPAWVRVRELLQYGFEGVPFDRTDWEAVAASPDLLARWRYLASCGLPYGWRAWAAEVAAAGGNVAALTELLDARARAVANGDAAAEMEPAEAAARAAWLWHRQREADRMQQQYQAMHDQVLLELAADVQQRIHEERRRQPPDFVGPAAEAAARAGQVAVLSLLRDRCGPGVLKLEHAGLASRHGHVEAVGFLAEALEPVPRPAPAQAAGSWGGGGLQGQGQGRGRGAGEAAAMQAYTEAVLVWTRAWSLMAKAGAGVALLQLLRERHGASPDLEAVAEGGSVEATEWAFEQLRAEMEPGAVFFHRHLASSLQCRGNMATAAWFRERGLSM
ncbi:hypothetical protein HYH02_000961 [Chlamydomonas schloesseri]|uniref:Uncharacterized protein n=1 Tax=Chlamydomonas schloesseri TaxID=2026947 RepID=A0A835WW55_9CHLO|nr:hypothetical protein HYH02_000961 [Chlamydomonas schloesseri]|eukprot:KAG2455142.1 hypothetical protein HYH02_000961 [Chlamydomonas schloesseri]